MTTKKISGYRKVKLQKRIEDMSKEKIKVYIKILQELEEAKRFRKKCYEERVKDGN